MKKLLSILVVLLACSGFAETWTFHGLKTEWLYVVVQDHISQEIYIMQWNWPGPSGLKTNDVNRAIWSDWSGYQDAISITVGQGILVEIYLASPKSHRKGLFEWGIGAVGAGEYWIDYGPGGVGRISTTQPADFGRWAWDGSINPSWIAAKKGFAMGHNRKPLPSPK